MSKHIINSPKTLVTEALTGLTFSNPSTVLDAQHNVLTVFPVPNRVNLLSGGGSGHEPHSAGMVGEGLLSCSISGNVFASPNSRAVEAGLSKLSSGTGTLIIVKNYTGDILHFGMARERYLAANPSKDNIRMVVVGDDVAVPRSQGLLTGRRGLAATVLVYKIAGALAAANASLDEVEFIASLIASSSATIGMGLEHTHVPGTEARTESYLKSNEIELGMGIHNEPGISKISPIPTASILVDQMLSMVVDTTDKERAFLPFQADGKDSVILLVNNLGGLPLLELLLLVKEASVWLASKNIIVERVVSGSLVSSLNLPGFSFTLLLLPRAPVVPTSFESTLSFDSDLIISCFDAPSQASGWPWTAKERPETHVEEPVEAIHTAVSQVVGPAPTDSVKFLAAIKLAMENLVTAEPDITRFDTIGGDGDCGLTLKGGAEAILAALANNSIPSNDVVAAVSVIADIVEDSMGGTAGGIYSLFLSSLKKGIFDTSNGSKIASAQIFSIGLESALNRLYNYTRARRPSRTLIDPLSAFIETFVSNPDNFEAAYQEAKLAVESTKTQTATAGRAAYVDQASLASADVPDAGAYGLLMILDGVRSVM